MKIVQQLLLNSANFTILSPKGKLAKEVTHNLRIQNLIEKYEKRLEKTGGNFSEGESTRGSSKALFTDGGDLDAIVESDDDYDDEEEDDEDVSRTVKQPLAGEKTHSLATQAIQFIKEFE